MLKKIIYCFSIIYTYSSLLMAQNQVVVAADGSGDFKSIQAAIDYLPDSATQQRTIFIKPGVYREKIFITKPNILLKGEKNVHFGKDWATLQKVNMAMAAGGGVLIIASEAREIFRCTHADDWGAATMNIRTIDISLENLLIVNDYGFNAKGDTTLTCDGKSKTVTKNGHQFALRCMPPTQRLSVKNCNFHALGGDTVSPWDVEKGNYQFFDCTMEGDVDFYCPRGWSYAEHCHFICHNLNAAIWHDGTGTKDAKTVLKNCQFVGDKGFKLGRFHRDAQFYLLNCTFSKEMADADIYPVRKDTLLAWGKRVFYFNCHGEKTDFAWHQTNISENEAQQWTQDGTLKARWDGTAQANPPLLILSSRHLATRFAETVMKTYPDSIVVKKFAQHLLQDKQGTNPNTRPASWNYEEAVVLKGFESLWNTTKDKKYLDYTKKMVDHFIDAEGNIRTYEPTDYNSDQITGGLQLINLYQATQEPKYRKAADLLRRQIEWQPRTKSGGFWHKHKYPHQMWLDEMYMLNFYYAQYCHTFNAPEYFDDVANQFILLEKHAKNPKTGLYYHGWDESKYQKWANPQNGQSPEVWSRSVGWYAMALVEVLEIFPKNHPKRTPLIQILKDLAAALTLYQDKNTGVWYQITDKADKKGNYLEASGSTMFTYTLAKGVRLGFLDKKYETIAQKGFDGILKNFVTMDTNELIHIHQSCSGAGLGGLPYRAGDFDYYVHEPIRSDDLKTIGPFIQAALEMEKMGYQSKVLLPKKE